MRHLSLIIFLVISLLTGGRTWNSGCSKEAPDAGSISTCTEESGQAAKGRMINREICLTSATACSFSGAQEQNSPSLRTSSSSRPGNHHTRSNYRFLKGGKLIEGNRASLPPAESCQVSLPGFTSPENCLFTLCRLRL